MALNKYPSYRQIEGSGTETKQRHPVNLKQYRKVEGKWQFVPVARDLKGNPDPRLVLLDGEPVSSKGGTLLS